MILPKMPHVACLLVTHGNPRLAIESYKDQTYAYRSLMILASDDQNTPEAVFCPQTLSKGGRWNLLCEMCCHGDLVCLLDDQCVFSPCRIEEQVRHLLTHNRYLACIYDGSWFYDGEIHWHADSSESMSLIFFRSLFGTVIFPDHEEPEVGFVRRLAWRGEIARLQGKPFVRIAESTLTQNQESAKDILEFIQRKQR